MDWPTVARTLTAPLTGGQVTYRSALLNPPQRKLRFLQDSGVAFTGGYDQPLVHGPGTTDLLNAPSLHGDGNSAVYACLAALATAYIEAPWRVYRRTGAGQREEVTTGAPGALAALLARPNPHMSGAEVWAWCQWAKHIDGNFYLRKLRSGNARTGPVVELWPISPSRIELRSERGDYITAYRYRRAPGDYEDLLPENIIHGRLGLDDRDHRRGLAPLKRLVRALTTDAAAERWAERLLSNGAMPGLLIRSKVMLTADKAAELKAWAGALYGGERMGEVGVIDQDADMAQFGFSPEQMAFEALSKQPETRISAVLRVPAIVAGLGVGLDQATYSNAQTLSEWFTERTMMPLWAMDEAKIQTQLVPDFTTDPAIEAAHDLSDVRALQEDEDAKYQRLDRAVQGGWILVNEARADVGLDPLPDGDVRRVPINVQEVSADLAVAQLQAATDKLTAPPPEPAAAPPGADGLPPPTPLRAAASRTDGEQKFGVTPVVVSEADVAAWQARARALAATAPLLPALLAANGVAHG